MLTAEQLETRKTGIGGSEAAAAIGLSRWKTPLTLWLEKRGEIAPFAGNEATKWGEYLEAPIRQEYSNRTGRTIFAPGTVRHAEIPFLLCTPDGTSEDGRLIEIKNTKYGEGWGEEGTDHIPTEHLIQVQHNMLVTGLAVADVAVLIAGSDFRIYEVPADPDLHTLLIEREAEFWVRVEKGIRPEPMTAGDIQRLYGHVSTERRAQADEEIAGACALLAALKAKAAVTEAEIEKIETRVKTFMADADTLVDGKAVLATWKAAKPSARFDATAFRASHPDLCEAFTKVSEPSRRFLLKTNGAPK